MCLKKKLRSTFRKNLELVPKHVTNTLKISIFNILAGISKESDPEDLATLIEATNTFPNYRLTPEREFCQHILEDH